MNAIHNRLKKGATIKKKIVTKRLLFLFNNIRTVNTRKNNISREEFEEAEITKSSCWNVLRHSSLPQSYYKCMRVNSSPIKNILLLRLPLTCSEGFWCSLSHLDAEMQVQKKKYEEYNCVPLTLTAHINTREYESIKLRSFPLNTFYKYHLSNLSIRWINIIDFNYCCVSEGFVLFYKWSELCIWFWSHPSSPFSMMRYFWNFEFLLEEFTFLVFIHVNHNHLVHH